jgi:DNA-directed RNA polymerase specialized sigma24 family protein
MTASNLPGDAYPDPIPVVASDPLDPIGLFSESLRSHYVRRATALLGLLGIDEAQFSGEDAFQAALIELCQRVREESAPPIETLDEFRRSFAPRLRDCLVDERRRQGAHKRGGGLLMTSLSLVMDESFDLVDTHTRPPNERLDDADQAEWLISLLDGEGASLRAFLALREKGNCNEEIASRLGVSLATVERKFAMIRAIWAPHFGDDA